jgi:hypothetical protein
MEVYLSQKSKDDPRVLDRKPYEHLFVPLAPVSKARKAAPKNSASQPQESLNSYNPADDPNPNELLSFFQNVGWRQVENDFIQGYNAMKILASEENKWQAKDEVHTTILQYTSWKWDDAAKLKNAPREYAPILGGVLFERYYVEQYRQNLLNHSSAGDLRIKMNEYLDCYVDDGYKWWDGLDVDPEAIQYGNDPHEPSNHYTSLRKEKKFQDLVQRLSRHINGIERAFTDDTPGSSRGVPGEVAKALDILIRVCPPQLLTSS